MDTYNLDMKDLTSVRKTKKQDYYSSPLSLTSQFYFCPVPLRLDTYSGCLHGCKYCFANNSMMKFIGNDEFSKEQVYENVKPTKFEYVKKYFDIAFEGAKNTFNNQEAIAVECIKKRVPIHFGGMSDPLQALETEFQVTYKVLGLLKKYNYPVIFSTKGKLILDDKYFNIIKDYENFALQISLIDDRQEVIDILEPLAMSVKERLQALKKYHDIGKWTACRIQPFIIGLSESRIIPLLDKLKEVGVQHVMVEGLKFMSGNKQANKRISQAFKQITGKEYNLEAYYKSYSAKTSGNDLELPTWRKYQYVKIFVEECAKRRMTYGVADNDLRWLGCGSCCCGIGNLKGFENTLKYNTGVAIDRALKQGLKTFNKSIIENEWISAGKFRCPMSGKKAFKRFGNELNGGIKDFPLSQLANRPLKELFNNAWMSGNKNSPSDQIIIKNLGAGVYRFKTEEELKRELENRGTQKTL